MTTIAVYDGVMAADSCQSAGNEVAYGANKLRRIAGDSMGEQLVYLIGYAGSYYMIEPFHEWMEHCAFRAQSPMRWYAAGGPELPEPNDIDALIYDHRGHIYHMNGHGYAVQVPREFDAIGSGADFALGAMALGVSARSAVEIASRLDAFTGGQIREVFINE